MTEEPTQETTEETLENAIDEASEAVAVQSNELKEMEAGGEIGDPIGMQGILSVPVQITVLVGRTQMDLARLVALGPGSLVLLDREAHEPADIVVNGKLVARGEVVTIDDKYAVRITEIA